VHVQRRRRWRRRRRMRKRKKETFHIKNHIGRKDITTSASIQKKEKCINITIKCKNHLKIVEYNLLKIQETYKIFKSPLWARTNLAKKELRKGIPCLALKKLNKIALQLRENKKTCITFFLAHNSNNKDLVIPICEINAEIKSDKAKKEWSQSNKKNKIAASFASKSKLYFSYLHKKNDPEYLLLKANKIAEHGGLKNYLRWQQKSLNKIFILREVCKERNESDYTYFIQASVLGKTRCIIQKDKCFLEHLSSARQIKSYMTQEEYSAGIKFEYQNIYLPVEKKKHLKGKWISLLHPGSENFMHWVTEVMPRLFLKSELSEDVGILVDDSLPSNMYELLRIVCFKRTIYKVSKYELVTVDTLICPILCNYSLLWEKGNKFLGGDWYLNKSSIQNMRIKLNSLIPVTYSNKAENVYLRRCANFRRVANEKSILKVLKSKGYKSIVPSSKNLLETLKRIKNAKNLILQAGAAFGNIIFIRRPCSIFVMVPPTNRIHRKLFTDFANALNHKVEFIKGYNNKASPRYSEALNYTVNHPLNADYNIDIKKIQKTVLKETKT
jgi:hypothetical protein